jgi:choline dehydrogenase-like flavoprotein
MLNENCESYEVKGLYVLPTAGASNPSITLIANAIRVCDNIPKD